MERLTFDGKFCDISMCRFVPGGSFCEDGDCSQRQVWERLKQYEDTGLEPEDIRRAFDEDAVLKLAGGVLGLEPDRLRDLVQADREGRCVVLPCKVGDAIYMPTGIRHCKITGYEEDECDGFHIASDGVLQIKAKCWTGNHGTYGVPGKTVFLTREEVEAALREG